MALIKPSTPFDAIKRKFAKSDEIHFRNRKADNATISVRMKHPYNGGNSANQIAHRAKFKSASDAVKALTSEEKAHVAGLYVRARIREARVIPVESPGKALKSKVKRQLVE